MNENEREELEQCEAGLMEILRPGEELIGSDSISTKLDDEQSAAQSSFYDSLDNITKDEPYNYLSSATAAADRDKFCDIMGIKPDESTREQDELNASVAEVFGDVLTAEKAGAATQNGNASHHA